MYFFFICSLICPIRGGNNKSERVWKLLYLKMQNIRRSYCARSSWDHQLSDFNNDKPNSHTVAKW